MTGIVGANCRHSFFAFAEGVMERTHTHEQVDPVIEMHTEPVNGLKNR